MLVESQLCTILVAQQSIDSVSRWRLWMVMPQETSRIQAAWQSITLDSSANPDLLLQEEGLDMSNSHLIFFSHNNELDTTAILKGQKHLCVEMIWDQLCRIDFLQHLPTFGTLGFLTGAIKISWTLGATAEELIENTSHSQPYHTSHLITSPCVAMCCSHVLTREASIWMDSDLNYLSRSHCVWMKIFQIFPNWGNLHLCLWMQNLILSSTLVVSWFDWGRCFGDAIIICNLRKKQTRSILKILRSCKPQPEELLSSLILPCSQAMYASVRESISLGTIAHRLPGRLLHWSCHMETCGNGAKSSNCSN